MTTPLSDSLYEALHEVGEGRGWEVADRWLRALRRLGYVAYDSHRKLPGRIRRGTISITDEGRSRLNEEP